MISTTRQTQSRADRQNRFWNCSTNLFTIKNMVINLSTVKRKGWRLGNKNKIATVKIPSCPDLQNIVTDGYDWCYRILRSNFRGLGLSLVLLNILRRIWFFYSCEEEGKTFASIRNWRGFSIDMKRSNIYSYNKRMKAHWSIHSCFILFCWFS